MRYKKFFIHGYLGELLVLGISPVIVILLSKFLSREEYGIMAVLLILITIFTVIFDAGINQYLIYSDNEDLPKSLFNVFILNTSSIIIIGIIIGVFLPTINSFLKINLDKISALQYLVACSFYLYSGTLTTVLLKNFKTKKLILPKLLKSIAPGIIIIIFLDQIEFTRLYTLSHLISSALMFITLLYHSIPFIRITRKNIVLEINKTLSYSIWIIFDGIGVWFITWFDHLMLSVNHNIEITGKYRLALSLSSFAFAISVSPLIRLLMPYLKESNSIQEQKNIITLTIRWIMLLFIVIAVLAVFNTELILSVLQIDLIKWENLQHLIIIILFHLGLGWIVAPFQELYKVMGKTKLIFQIMWMQLIVYIPFYFLATKLMFEAYLICKLLLIFTTIFLHNFYSKKTLGINIFSLMKDFLKTGIISLLLILIYYHSKNILDKNSIIIDISLSLLFVFTVFTIHKNQIKSLINKFNNV